MSVSLPHLGSDTQEQYSLGSAIQGQYGLVTLGDDGKVGEGEYLI